MDQDLDLLITVKPTSVVFHSTESENTETSWFFYLANFLFTIKQRLKK